jgi:inosine-uridine nucleoside N-ribohydrolase
MPPTDVSRTPSRRAIILDCDPGLDDALAILTASRYGDLVAITTVNGNVGVDKTTRNALITAQIAEIDVPVHRGAARPLLSPALSAARVHGESGLQGPTLPPLTRDPASTDAVAFLLQLTRERADIDLVAVGPLTNVALALRADHEFGSRLRSLTIMGGGARMGNVTPVAEFNIWADPEAAAVVFDSGIHLTMIGLDLTTQVRATAAHVEELRAAATPTSIFAADLISFYRRSVMEMGSSLGGSLHDPCAVLAVTHPELFTLHDRFVAIELAGTHTRGMTVVDERGHHDGPAANARVAYGVQSDAVLRLIMDAAISPRP